MESSRQAQHFYSIIDYTVPEGQEPNAVALTFETIQRDWVSSYPGFVVARFLVNTNGDNIRAIVEWESEEALKQFERVSDTEGRMNALKIAFERHSTQGSRQTFRGLSLVFPTGKKP